MKLQYCGCVAQLHWRQTIARKPKTVHRWHEAVDVGGAYRNEDGGVERSYVEWSYDRWQYGICSNRIWWDPDPVIWWDDTQRNDHKLLAMVRRDDWQMNDWMNAATRALKAPAGSRRVGQGVGRGCLGRKRKRIFATVISPNWRLCNVWIMQCLTSVLLASYTALGVVDDSYRRI